QPAAPYPPKIAVYALAGRAATHAYMALHYLLAGGFAFVALRGLGLGWPGAALGTVTWAFSPLNLESHYHPVRLACLTWVPLVLLAFVGALAGRAHFRLAFVVLWVATVALGSVLNGPLHLLPLFSRLRGSYCWVALSYLPAAYLAGAGLDAVLARTDAVSRHRPVLAGA